MFTRRRTGFTLVELLVVIAIIGLLAGLIFPVVTKVQGQAKIRQCQANLKELGTAMNLYYSIFQEYPHVTWGGKKKLGQLLACKRTGLSPKQLVCPVTGTLPNGSAVYVSWTVETDGGGQVSATSAASSVDYAGRRVNVQVPGDAVDPAGTPLAAGDDNCRKNHGSIDQIVFLDGHVEQVSDTDTFNNNTNSKSLKMDVLDTDW